MSTSFSDSETLGKFLGQPDLAQHTARTEELRAAYERIDELKASLAEMLSIYWGAGDGEEPAPACIQRAETALEG